MKDIEPGTLIEINGNIDPTFCQNEEQMFCFCLFETKGEECDAKIGLLKNGTIGMFLEKVNIDPTPTIDQIILDLRVRILTNEGIGRISLKDLRIINNNGQD